MWTCHQLSPDHLLLASAHPQARLCLGRVSARDWELSAGCRPPPVSLATFFVWVTVSVGYSESDQGTGAHTEGGYKSQHHPDVTISRALDLCHDSKKG